MDLPPAAWSWCSFGWGIVAAFAGSVAVVYVILKWDAWKLARLERETRGTPTRGAW